MGTPWGCPTTGVTPSERKHRVSSQGGSRAEGKMVSWLCGQGVNPNREGRQEVGGTPLSPILWATRNPNSPHSREQCQALSWECFLLLSLPLGPLLPHPRVTWGQMEPGIVPPSPVCCEERPQPGQSQGTHTALGPV